MNNEMHSHQIAQCLQLIKRKLKEKGMTYIDVAVVLSVSENTVKRILNSNDISFERLLTLADLCELPMDRLLQEVKQQPTPYNYFTKEQDQAFYKNPHLWHYFCELFYHSKTPEVIQAQNGITELSTYRYLRGLEKVELLELSPNNKITFLVATPIGFSSNSLVLKANIAKHIKSTCDAVISDNKSPNHFMWVKPMRMPQSLFSKMNEELVTIINKYSEVAEIAFANNIELPKFQTTLVGHPLEFDDYTVGDIINIDEI